MRATVVMSGWSTTLRTQRFDSRAEAEAVLATVRAGGTYRVDLTPASAVVIPTDGTPVFEAD